LGGITFDSTASLEDIRRFFVYMAAIKPTSANIEDLAAQLKMHGQMVDVRAEIKALGQFSAHADYSEILRWLGNFKRPPKAVFIVHGEPEPRRALREKIVKELGWKVTLPEHLEKFDLK
jgi:metallo-beta-lactamase family protein